MKFCRASMFFSRFLFEWYCLSWICFVYFFKLNAGCSYTFFDVRKKWNILHIHIYTCKLTISELKHVLFIFRFRVNQTYGLRNASHRHEQTSPRQTGCLHDSAWYEADIDNYLLLSRPSLVCRSFKFNPWFLGKTTALLTDLKPEVHFRTAHK